MIGTAGGLGEALNGVSDASVDAATPVADTAVDAQVYTADTLVEVYPFTRQADGREVVIGRPDIVVYLALPPDAVELLDQLAAGKTVGEAQAYYQQTYGELPDMGEFLTMLQAQGFVQPKTDSGPVEWTMTRFGAAAKPVRYHFASFPQKLAQRIFSVPMLALSGVLIVLAFGAIAADPNVIPGWDAVLAQKYLTLATFTLLTISFVTVFLHELAHLVAARAVGINSRMGIGNRLWIMVAETDLTGIWSIPRHQRYLPLLAGPLVDAVSAAVLILFVYTVRQGWIEPPFAVLWIARAMLFTYLLRLLWQTDFFLRTDLYYVFSSIFKCKNLMQETETFLGNQIKRVFRRGARVDQSHVPAAEMRVVRWYSIFWIVGRAGSTSKMLFITLPLMYSYILIVGSAFGRGFAADPYRFIDALVITTAFFIPQVGGFGLWFRSLLNFRSRGR
jgi:hypothetical protein